MRADGGDVTQRQHDGPVVGCPDLAERDPPVTCSADQEGGIRMRRSFAVLSALAIVLLLPVGASAARISKETDHVVSVSCDALTSADESMVAFFGVNVSDLFGSDVGFDAWEGTEPAGQADLSRDYEQPADVGFDGATFDGSFPTVRADGSPGGTATFHAELTAAGDPQSFSDAFKDGNRRVRFSGTSQAFSVSGSLSVSGGPTFDLGTCVGDSTTVTSSGTNPTAYVARFSDRFLNCDLTNPAGDTGFIFVDLAGGAESFVDSAVFPKSGPPNIGATAGVDISSGSVDSDLETYDWDTGEILTAAAHVTLTATATGETFTNILRDATNRRVTRGEVIDIEGTLTIDGHTFDLGACVGQDSQTKEIRTQPHGPKPGGKAPANDLPGGAKTLTLGASSSQQTKGASPAAEAPYECLTFTDPETGEVFQVPVGNTVWYTFTGNGSAMTIDTAGSDFDTVIAVYTKSGSTYTPVEDGCVDDSPTPPIGRTLQGHATIQTTLGTVYYVQIGGFPDSFPYGNLKVRLR